MNRCLIIGEAGVNHNGSLDLAIELVDAAVEAGADIIKFQTFKADKLVSAAAPKARYQIADGGGTEWQLDMLRRLELSHDNHRKLVLHCAKRNIEFLSSPFDQDSLSFLTDDLGLSRVKLGSGELTNAPLLVAVGRSNADVIISTGMATLGDVEAALGALAHGYCRPTEHPSRKSMASILSDPDAWAMLRRKVIILHCTTEYPTPPEQINLRALKTLRDAFQIPVGFSDHSIGTNVSIAAVALGAIIVEKHLTLDRDLAGPDHKASLKPREFAAMVAGIREAELAFGDGVKRPQPCELPNEAVARKSVVAAKNISSGDVYDDQNLTVKRPGTGRSPFDYFDLLGSKAPRDIAQDELI